MSELQNFDQFFKKKMEEYSPPVPEHIWANIIAEKNRRRPVPFLVKFFNSRNILLAAAMFVLIAGGVFIFTKSGRQEKDQTINKPSTKNIIDDKITTQTNTGNSREKEMPEINTATTDSAIQDEVATDNTSTEIKQGSSPQNKELNASSVIHKNTNQRYTAHSLMQPGKRKKLNPAGDSEEEEMTETTQLSNTSKANNELLLFKMLYYPEKARAGYTLKSNISPDFVLPPCPEIERNAAGNKDYIEFYLGPDFAKKTYTASPDSGSTTLMQKRKESTSFSSAFSAGVRYTRVFSNGVSIRGGINFSQVNEKFTYVQSNIVQVTYIIDPATGDTTGSYITNGSRYKTTYNHYRTIDVPVVFGFETGNGRIHANLNAGMVFNIRSWQNGETIGLDSTSQPIIINTGKGNSAYQYKTNIGAGFITAASIYYKLNDRFHLLAEPYWRYNFSPISKELISLQEKYSSIGLRLGLRMDLQY